MCGREYIRRDTGTVKIGDSPDDARDYCNTAADSEHGFAVFWHSAEQLSREHGSDV